MPLALRTPSPDKAPSLSTAAVEPDLSITAANGGLGSFLPVPEVVDAITILNFKTYEIQYYSTKIVSL